MELTELLGKAVEGLAAPSPLPLLLQRTPVADKGSFFISPSPPPDTQGSDLSQFLCTDPTLRHAGVQLGCFLLHFRYSVYCCFKGRDLRMSLTLPRFSKLRL